MKEFVDAISQVGFPIVVSLLLLIRIESKLERFGDKLETMNKTIGENTSATTKLTDTIEERIPRRRK